MDILENKIGKYKFRLAQKKSKGTIIFIHGFATNSDYHDDVSNKFVNYDYYAFELPGHGYTYIKKDIFFEIGFFVNYCISMIKELELNNIILIGHSMGGSLAIRVANKICENIKKLVVVTPMNSSFNFNYLKLYFLLTSNTFNKTLKLNNILYKDLTKTLGSNAENYIDQENKYKIKNLEFFNILKKKLYSIKNMKECSKNEKLLSLPTLIIVSEFDKLISYKSAIKSIKRQKEFVQVSIFKESSHIPFKEEKEKYYKDIIDFIE